MQFASELARSNLNPERTGCIDGLGYSRLQKWFSEQFFMICSICCAVSLWHAERTSFMQPDLGDVYLKCIIKCIICSVLSCQCCLQRSDEAPNSSGFMKSLIRWLHASSNNARGPTITIEKMDHLARKYRCWHSSACLVGLLCCQS